uniref:Alcohol oxidase n=1 Tax=Ganoderma boninense TaxID=34458 RepID=A0A5K1K321_9APHY|nr:Alcohol oxidase [Ganoderma boninense]
MSHFQSGLSSAVLLGFVGGEKALAALEATYINGRRPIPSAFNSPGSYIAATGFSWLVKSRIWDGPHAGVSLDPNALKSETTSSKGPKFTAAFSGSTIPTTGPIAKAVVDYSRKVPITVVDGRVTTSSSVTIVELPEAPESEVHPVTRISAPVIVPVLASGAAAAACGVVGDWTTLAMIVLGMACNAFSSLALQAGDLTFTRPVTTPGAPAGDGYLESGNEIIVLKGSEAAVSSVTRGRFTLRFRSESALRTFSTCSSLLTLQCIIQLLIIPQGTYVGQLFFLATMIVSWLYNSYVARQESAAWQKLVLVDLLKAPNMQRYSLGTRSQAAVFLMQVLKPANVEEQLSLLIPNNTPVWKTWRQAVARSLQNSKFDFEGAGYDAAGSFNGDEKELLATLLSDAQSVMVASAKF